MEISFKLNGQICSLSVDGRLRLLDVLRNELGLAGTKEGCREGECGACTVLLNGRAVNACLLLIGQVDGKELQTIEGIAKDPLLSLIQQAFVEYFAIQCGFCTPGMIMSAASLLLHNPDPAEAEIRNALSGNICRCSDYSQIVTAVRQAAIRLQEVSA